MDPDRNLTAIAMEINNNLQNKYRTHVAAFVFFVIVIVMVFVIDGIYTCIVNRKYRKDCTVDYEEFFNGDIVFM